MVDHGTFGLAAKQPVTKGDQTDENEDHEQSGRSIGIGVCVTEERKIHGNIPLESELKYKESCVARGKVITWLHKKVYRSLERFSCFVTMRSEYASSFT